jgi:Fe(3+) dicitrate transport protein
MLNTPSKGLAVCLALATSIAAASTPTVIEEEIKIIGDPANTQNIPGSAFVLTEVELEKFEFSDIHRILRQVPGVYLQEEEGYGLRPNIGIRGSGSGRSGKVNVMEDGILVAPAPYAGPEAYYFPTAARISTIEVLKGPHTLRYGPSTVGGAINLVSTQIPEDYSGAINIETGQYGEQRQHAWYGGAGEQFGFLIESHQHEADGFHQIARSNRDSGFDKQDYMVKLQWRSAPDAAISQRLDFKFNHAEEVSNSSYIGLTDADFERNPYARYGLTEIDQMTNEQQGVVLRHRLDFSETLNLTTSIYRNEFQRNWHKVDQVNGQSISGIINQANNGDTNAIGILHGTVDLSGPPNTTNNIRVKNNNRQYYAKGIQFELAGLIEGDSMNHNWVVGARIHEDEVDRLQPVDVFNQTNGSLVFAGVLPPNAAGDNRVESAEALSVWIMDQMAIGDWQITASLRFEDIETQRVDYANDPTRNAPPVERDKNLTDAVLAGLGATYALNENWKLLAGVHQGFAPANGGALVGTEPEESTNYEFGVRYRGDTLGFDAIGFYSDYQNTIRNCSLANPCPDNRTFGTESLGKSRIQGVELALDTNFYSNESFNIPLTVAYTWTDAETTGDSDTSNILKGDVFEYLPETVFNASIGLEYNSGWSAYLSASRIDEMCINSTCNRPGVDTTFLKTDSYTVFDLAASLALKNDAEVYFKIDNLLDDAAIVARSPAGARVNKPRTALVGLRVSF